MIATHQSVESGGVKLFLQEDGHHHHLTFKALNGLAPSYLSELIALHSPTRTLRSSTESLLTVPTSNQAFGDRAFSVCAQQLWIKLPQAIKASDNVDIFKKRLKTHLFIGAFG